MSFRFFATPTVVFRSSRLGEDFSKFPESSYRSSKKKTENCANHDSYPSPLGGVKEWFGSLSIQLPSSKLQIPDSCLFFQVPAHLHTFIFCQRTIRWLAVSKNDRKTPVNSEVVLCGQNEVKSAKKKRLIDFLRLCLGALKAVSANITFSSRLRATYYCACHPKNQYFQIVPYLCCFWGLSLKLGINHPY